MLKTSLFLSLLIFSSLFSESCNRFGKEPQPEPIPVVLDKSHGVLLGVTLDSTNAYDLTNLLGQDQPVLLKVEGREDSTHGPFVYCYYSKTSPSIRVSFWTGGSEDPVVYKYILKESDQPDEKECSGSSSIDKNVKTGGGVTIGMSRSEFLNLFPGKPQVSGDTVRYQYEKFEKYQVPIPTNWNPDVQYTGEWHSSWVEGIFNNKKLKKYSLEMGGEMEWD